MLICPRKFKRCWSPRKFANFANICFPPLELTFLKNLSFALFQYFLLHRFQFSCHTICIGCEPGLENFQFVKYWKIGELPKQSTAKIVNKTAKPSIILTGKILKKGYMYFTRSTLTYYIILLNIIFYWNWLKRGHFTIFLTGSEKDQTVILFSNIP